jgi:hypothetical protein
LDIILFSIRRFGGAVSLRIFIFLAKTIKPHMTKEERQFLVQVHKRIAEISVGPSAIRNQGAPGIIKISRRFFFKQIDLKVFRRKLVTRNYTKYLDDLTKQLVKKFPKNAKSWGAARKGLNLFLREVAYNHYLADYLKISNNYKENLLILKNLEVPLDKDVGTGLYEKFPDLPKWTSIKDLTVDSNWSYQQKAVQYAQSKKTIRVHLDLEFWRRGKS